MKSNLANMVLSLTVLTVMVGAALAWVNNLTAEPIAQAKAQALADALSQVLPPFDNNPAETATRADGLKLYSATMSGEAAGFAVESYSDDGFGGRFEIVVGFDAKDAVYGYRILSHAETPGLGAKMDTWFATMPHDIKGTSIPLAVKADGGEIDAITGATISSRAFLGAVNRARKALETYKNGLK